MEDMNLHDFQYLGCREQSVDQESPSQLQTKDFISKTLEEICQIVHHDVNMTVWKFRMITKNTYLPRQCTISKITSDEYKTDVVLLNNRIDLSNGRNRKLCHLIEENESELEDSNNDHLFSITNVNICTKEKRKRLVSESNTADQGRYLIEWQSNIFE